MIYSGTRPTELYSLKSADVHLDGQYFEITHGKNENAKRKVPIYHRTLPFYEYWINKGKKNLITTVNGKPMDGISKGDKVKQYFWTPLERCGVLYRGDRKHLLYDARHTFASMWTEKRLSEVYRRKIQGHSGKGIGEQVYTHILIEDLISECNKL